MKKFTDLTLEQYLNELASQEPVPGGGSVSAYVVALGMGLTQMVGRIALRRKMKSGLSAQEQREEHTRVATIQGIVDSLEKTRRDAFQVVNLDPQVYGQVQAAWTDPAKLEDALENSFRLQADLAFLAVMGRDWNVAMADMVSGSIKNDLIVSAGLLDAGFQGAYHTALINVKYMKDPERKARAEKGLAEVKMRFDDKSKPS